MLFLLTIQLTCCWPVLKVTRSAPSYWAVVEASGKQAAACACPLALGGAPPPDTLDRCPAMLLRLLPVPAPDWVPS
jgi:hypothetical protein